MEYYTKIYILLIVTLFSTGCNKPNNKIEASAFGDQQVSEVSSKVSINKLDKLINIDISKEYPKRDINYEDIADFEYIQLETNSDFLCGGRGGIVAVTDSIIVFSNRQDGSIYFFDRSGKAIKKINRKGEGGEEYALLNQLLYDEENRELYVNDMMKKVIFVYDLNGNYKRKLHHLNSQYSDIYSFNSNSLIAYRSYLDGESKEKYPFIIISKKDGSLIKNIPLPLEKRFEIGVIRGDAVNSEMVSILTFPILKISDTEFILNEVSSDTIYLLDQDYKLKALFAQTPSVHETDPPSVLILHMKTLNHLYIWNTKKEYNWETKTGFSTTPLMYDLTDEKIYEINSFFHTKDEKFRYSIQKDYFIKENVFVGTIQPFILKEFENDLPENLKKIAAQMKEDDNPLLVLMKFK